MEEFSRENISGGWATFVVLLSIFIAWRLKRFTRSPLSPSPSPSQSPSLLPSNFDTVNSGLRMSEIVSDADLKFLIDTLDGVPSEDDKWDHVIDKRNNLVSYNAKCCKPKNGPLKYLSATVFENISSLLLRDFYLDNHYRKQWDNTIVQHEQLHVDTSSGIEIGRTVKKFPLLTPREYVLAWKLWEGRDNTFFCFIKECEHPLATRQKKYVRVGLFRSGWRIRELPGRNACEITMFHQEDAGLHVEMAKLAFAKGIWSYVCKMDSALRKYCVSRHHSSVMAVNLMQKVPPSLDKGIGISSPLHSPATAFGQVSSEHGEKISRRPSRKLLARSLLLLGGAICLSRGHSSLGAKVVMAYIVTKLNKRGAAMNQRKQS